MGKISEIGRNKNRKKLGKRKNQVKEKNIRKKGGKIGENGKNQKKKLGKRKTGETNEKKYREKNEEKKTG